MSEEPERPPRRRAVRVLVVDDERLVRELLRARLEAEDFTVDEAADAETAFALAVLHQPGLVILDVRMPGMSGSDVVERLRATTPSTAVIIYSALGGLSGLRTGGALGAVAVVDKADGNLALMEAVWKWARAQDPG